MLESQQCRKGPFILVEMRPYVGPHLEDHPPLDPNIPDDGLLEVARELMSERLQRQVKALDLLSSSAQTEIGFLHNEDIVWSILEGEAVLLDLETGLFFSLNQVGTLIWERCDGKHTFTEICAALCEAFDVAEEIVHDDLTKLIIYLKQERLIITSSHE